MIFYVSLFLTTFTLSVSSLKHTIYLFTKAIRFSASPLITIFAQTIIIFLLEYSKLASFFCFYY